MKWALIGASNIAAHWMIPSIRAAGDEVVAVVSSDLARAQVFAHEHGIAHALDDERRVRECGAEAVYVSTTNDRHHGAVLRAAEQGCHVLCEKPLSLQLDAGREMVQACQKAGVVLGTNHHLRHNSAHRQMRRVLADHGLGRVIAARVSHAIHLREKLQGWRIDNPQAGGGVVLDIAVHNADSLAFLLGEHPVRVSAVTRSAGMGRGVEDQAMSIWSYASGVLASTHQGFNTPGASTRLEILGEIGSLEAQGVLGTAPGGSLTLRQAAGDEDLPLTHENPHLNGLREMHKAIAGQPHQMATGEDGLRSLAVALAVLKSAERGAQVEVEQI